MRPDPPNRKRSWTYHVAGGFGSILGGFFSPLCVGTMMLLALALCAQYSPSVRVIAAAESQQKLGARVPFVGCKADGQLGPVDAPKGKSMVLPISSEAARGLAYYKSAQGFGVLAPRGWHCFCVYGSSGYALYVSPQHILTADSVRDGFTGPLIELLGESGETSGRFGVAKIIACVFPEHRAFAEKVIEEEKDIAPAFSFPFGPYPKDALNYRSKEMVEFQTPANTDGLGSHSGRLRKSGNPISGVAILMGQTPDLLLLSVRLPQNLADLTPAIIQQVEFTAMHAEARTKS